MGGRIIPFTPQEGQGMPALDNTPVSRTQATVLRKALEEAARLRARQEAGGEPNGLAVARMQGNLRGEFFAEFLCEVGKCPARLYSTALAWMAARGVQGLPVPWEAELLEAVHTVEHRLSAVRGYLWAVTRLAELAEMRLAPLIAEKLSSHTQACKPKA